MSLKALIVGGCQQSYHRLEPVKPLFEEIFGRMGIDLTVSGIFHPDGGEAWTGDYSALTVENLRQFDLLLLYTTGNNRHGADVEAINRFVENGKSLIGIHNAADTFTDDPDFIAMLGGRFKHHPEQLDIDVEILDRDHVVTNGLKDFRVHDELYLFNDFHPEKVHLLAQTRSCDDNGPVPICWMRLHGKGRVFYLSLGHNPSVIADQKWQELFINGVKWSLNSEKALNETYSTKS